MKQPILVKLKMKNIYKNFLTFIGLLIVLVSIIGIMYLSYDFNSLFDSDIEVVGVLSINYINGKKFNILKNDKKIIEFSISNSSESVSYYNIGFMRVRGLGSYKLYYNDTLVMEGNLTSIDEVMTDYISIDTKETKMYTLEIYNNGDTNLKGMLNIRNQNGKIETFADAIIKNVSLEDNAQTKVGNEIASEDEGLIKSSDDIGVSYYFRGNVQNNYVYFGELTWRIVRINGDGTVRLVLNDTIDTLSNYYTTDNPNYEYKLSNINTFLENWMQENLSGVANNIANSKYCSDIGHDDGYNYLAYSRIITNKIPTLNCLGTTFNNNIGLMTIDEVILAGAAPDKNNQSYYLYNDSISESWYTMTSAKGNESSMNLFMIGVNGNLITDLNGNLYRKVRPVINLIKNIEMVGDGTINNPYRLKNE